LPPQATLYTTTVSGFPRWEYREQEKSAQAVLLISTPAWIIPDAPRGTHSPTRQRVSLLISMTTRLHQTSIF
jgi:hypothetical protein